MKLVIVESPTKAKTISKFLGKDYLVESSFGHIRDLPIKELGVDTENNFEPKYVIMPKAKKRISDLKKKAERANEVILAVDEDREGEAIAWHLAHALNLKDSKRIVFHEITKGAIEEALKNPRAIDMNLVDAQQARRVLDRLVGYKLSPLLWKKVTRGLSAGRVQSVAVRLIVERQAEIDKFKPDEYWTIEALLQSQAPNSKSETLNKFQAKLVKRNGKTISKLEITNKDEAGKIETDLENGEYKVTDIRKKEIKKTPPTPFTTSTLQQEASYKFGLSAKQTMFFAQKLYETGLITYHRTDSLNLSEEFLNKAHSLIKSKFGEKYASSAPIRYKAKSKQAQEAHEAIRPSNPEKIPDEIKASLDDKHYKLYNLIWQRSLACQMQPAIIDSLSVDIASGDYLFRTTCSSIKFDGFLKSYPAKITETILPPLEKNDVLDLVKLDANQHFTKPPAPYNEASLIKILEEYGIGRPSTYAPTISTIQDRNYVKKGLKKTFHPTEVGVVVSNLLVKHFPQIVDIQFTAEMEENLDAIAHGKKKWIPVIKDFYTPFIANLEKKDKEIDKKEVTEEKTDQVCDKCGSPMVIKIGRYGKFLACTNYPKCKNALPIKKEEAEEEEKTDKICPECNSPMKVRVGRYGKFFGCSNYPKCKHLEKYKKKE